MRHLQVLTICVALAGCASTPVIRTTGALPTTGTFTVAGDGGVVSPAFLVSILTKEGWSIDEAAPEWRAEVIASERSDAVGGFTEERKPGARDAWAIPQRPRDWWQGAGFVRTLTVVFASADGRSQSVSARTASPVEQVSWSALLEAAVTGEAAQPR